MNLITENIVIQYTEFFKNDVEIINKEIDEFDSLEL